MQCNGLSQQPAATAPDCAAACCSSDACQVWQFCPGGDAGCGSLSCWTGRVNQCSPVKGWQSHARDSVPPPPSHCDVECAHQPFTLISISPFLLFLNFHALLRVTFTIYNRYCQPSFDDSQWRVIDVPHDFVVEGSFSKTADQAHGYLPFGVGWYRKHMDLPAHDTDAVYELTLDGVQVRAPARSRFHVNVHVTARAVAKHRVAERAHAWAARLRLHVTDLRYPAGSLAGAQQRACCESRCHTARQLVV